MVRVTLGVDIGTSSSKGVLVDLGGTVCATATREHDVSRPQPGWVEMDASIWWKEFTSICLELTAIEGFSIEAVGVSGMGPCVLLTDHDFRPLRPAILYGVDTRSQSQISRLTEEFGAQEILDRCGSELSTQAVGPKLAWLSEHEPDIFYQAQYLFMPASWLVWNLTGNYVLDHHSASQSVPFYDTDAQEWFAPWVSAIAPDIELPPLLWPEDIAGTITAESAETTGLRKGIPVITGTIDAWMEAVSVDAQNPGDLMLMYGTTMFLVSTIAERITTPGLWGTIGAFPGTRSLAGGMATSGAITSWLRTVFGSPSYEELLEAAESAGVGAHGLLMLPYFAGERTPIADPDARGVIAGLTIEHTQGDLYRAALEATAMGVRHNIEALTLAEAKITRVVAVGGGTRGTLWTQIVSDVTGMCQEIPSVTIGASFGAAFLAARTIEDVSIQDWNRTVSVVSPRSEHTHQYRKLFELYRKLYPATFEIVHTLAEHQHRATVGLAD